MVKFSGSPLAEHCVHSHAPSQIINITHGPHGIPRPQMVQGPRLPHDDTWTAQHTPRMPLDDLRITTILSQVAPRWLEGFRLTKTLERKKNIGRVGARRVFLE